MILNMHSKKSSPHAIFHVWKLLCVGVCISNVSKTIFVVSIKKKPLHPKIKIG
jgi:hypothetical protein